MNLKELAEREEVLLTEVSQESGLMREIHLKLSEKGIYQRYDIVFQEYAQLAEKDVEALSSFLLSKKS